MTLWLWLAGCRPDAALEPYGGWPLWAELDLSDAADLGHVPARVGGAASGPLAFEDGTEAAGLQAVVGGGNQHGVGIALVDLDADGWLDLVLANGRSNVSGALTPSVLYWNRGDGTFEDGTADSGLQALLTGADLYSVAAADVDADGDVDLYLGGQPTNRLLLNRGDRTFVDGSDDGAAGTPSDPSLVADGRGKVVAIGDLDADGALDLVSATSTQPAPGAFVGLGRGDGSFRDATDDSGVRIASDGNPCAVMFTDYDNDGRADLWIWNDRGGHVLLHHDGDAWEDFGNRADRTSIRNPMGIDAADLDHDGDLDYYVSNIGAHPLLINQGDGSFEDQTLAAGTTGDFGWGLGFEDFDLDGWADLWVAQEDDRPALTYRNLGGARVRFERRELPRPTPLVDPGGAHNVAAAFGDVDRDGRVDVAWATTDGSRMVLHRNVTETGGHWLEVVVDEAPGTGERGGVGARVAISAGDVVQFRDLTAGSSRASMSALSARFGLGDWDGADWVVVLWPDGRQLAVTGVAGDRTLHLP